jgi:hypothetical protein
MERTFNVIEDSLSEAEVLYLLDIVKKRSGPDPKPLFEGSGLVEKSNIDKNEYPTIFDPDKLILTLINKVEDYYRSNYEILGDFVFSRAFGVTMHKGAILPPHRDEDGNEDGTYDGKKRSHVCSIILNDDYEGGQLLFPDQGVSIKPKAGSMVFFPGYYVSHGVREVIKGTRYVLLIFFYDMLPD